MERRLRCVARPRVEGDLGNSARRGKTLRSAGHWGSRGRKWAIERRQVVLDGKRVVEEEDLVPVSAEEEESRQLRVNVVHAELGIVLSRLPTEVVAELE